MSYIKNMFWSIFPILKYFIFSYLIVIIFYMLFYLVGYKEIDLYIINYGIYISLIFNVIYMFILKKKYKVIYESSKYCLFLSMLGFGIALFCNTLFLLINSGEVTHVSKIVLIISSVIIGPVIEEILFRYVLIRNLRCFNGRCSSLIISSIIFALFHNGLISMIYAFILGLVLGAVYMRKMNITNSIIVHSFANLASLYIYSFNPYILLLSFILLVVSVNILKRGYFTRH